MPAGLVVPVPGAAGLRVVPARAALGPVDTALATAALPPHATPPEAPAASAAPEVGQARALRLVTRRLDQAMTPVFHRALQALPLPDALDDADDVAGPGAPRISNTFNVQVALGGAAGALDARQIEEALGDWLRAAARRQGLMP